MAKDPPPTGSGGGSAGEGPRESLPRLTEVVPDFEELSPFYQRPSSAPAAGVDPARPYSSAVGDPESQQADLPVDAPLREPPLPPLRGAMVRTYPGAGSRQPYQNPFEITLDPHPVGLGRAIERIQSDRPPLPRRETTDPVLRSPPLTDPISRPHETRPETRRATIYDPVHEPPPRRLSRSHLPPIDVGLTAETVRDAPPTPQYQPLPPLRQTHSVPGTSYPHPPSRYAPYPERPTHDQPPTRRYSQTLQRDFPRPSSPTYTRSPTATTRPPPIYPPDQYPLYSMPPYARGGFRRASLASGSYLEERRGSRQESLRYPPPIPYGSSYPPQPYEYNSGRGYMDPYHGYVEYGPDRRLSQQEPGEQVMHLGVPERSYRPQMGGPPSPSSIRVQPPLHGTGLPAGTPGKRRGNLPKESKDKLKLWLSLHVDHPYPTEEEKKELAAEAGMTMGQINNWFINARRRTLPRIPGRAGSPSSSRNLRRRPGET